MMLGLCSKSKNPNRVFIGVVQQNNDGDPDCLHLYCKMIKDEREILPKVGADMSAMRPCSLALLVAPVGGLTPICWYQVSGDKEKPKVILENCPHADQVRMMRVQAEDAKGPTYGRWVTMMSQRRLAAYVKYPLGESGRGSTMTSYDVAVQVPGREAAGRRGVLHAGGRAHGLRGQLGRAAAQHVG